MIANLAFKTKGCTVSDGIASDPCADRYDVGPRTEDDGLRPATVGDLVSSYPGPALLLDANGHVLGASYAGLGLVPGLEDAPWWHTLLSWLAQVGQDVPVHHSSTISTVRGDLIVEWQSSLLGDGTIALLGRDVTMERHLRGALIDSRQRFRDLVELASDFAWETDAEGRFVYVSPGGALGYAASELTGRPAEDLLAMDQELMRLPFTADRPLNEAEVWLRRADGEIATVVVWARPILSEDDERLGVRGLCRDVTEDRRRDMALAGARARERVIAHILHGLSDATDPRKGLEQAVKDAAHAIGSSGCAVYPQDPGLAELSPLVHCLDTADPVAMTACFTAAGIVTKALSDIEPVRETVDGCSVLAVATLYRQQANGVLILWRAEDRGPWQAGDDVLARLIADQLGMGLANADMLERLRHEAERDGLTGLCNRAAVLSRMRADLGDPRPMDRALLYIDLDGFKAINDQFGHRRGDSILLSMGDLLRSVVGPDDVPGRLGGDEFVIWLRVADRDRAAGVAEAVVEGARDLIRDGEGTATPFGASVGVTCVSSPTTERLDVLVSRADAAMYRAKAASKLRTERGAWHVET